MRRALLVVVLLAAGCSFGQPRGSTTATTVAPERTVYVAIGGTESLDGDRAWPRELFRSLPPQTVYVNVARPDADAADARRDQLPRALELEPTVVTVWLDGDPSDVATIVAALRERGAVVLLADEAGVDTLADPDDIARAFLDRLGGE